MNHEFYMRRCFDLAAKGLGFVAPNPVVGAVLVHEGRIIGEGWHQKYGEAHAEVNAIAAVSESDRPLIPASVLYVSLEPCAHFGKTPPCADLIIREKIKKVVISNRDPFPDVNGKGIEKLSASGVEVITGILEKEGFFLNRRFFTFHTLQRPYIILKWAQTADGIIGKPDARLKISNPFTDRLVHRWRSDEAGIFAGANTVALDNPQLNNRFWYGNDPIRMTYDPYLKLSNSLHFFDGSTRTILFNNLMEEEKGMLQYRTINPSGSLPETFAKAWHQRKIQSVLIEGGPRTHGAFLQAGCYDEVRIITNTALYAGEGIPAPKPPSFATMKEEWEGKDRIQTFFRE